MEQDDLKQFKQSFYTRESSLETPKPKTASIIRPQVTKLDIKKNLPKKPA